MDAANKRIVINTIIIYVRMIIVTIVGLVTARYVLLALGVSDYGIYNVVAGVLAMLNIISTAMHTTTRRYVNVEMGNPDGDLNKVFNVCLLIHILFALLTLVLAESIGLFYINNYLNVPDGKQEDARFVFQISPLVAIIGMINVPYQALLNAYEKFSIIASLEITQSLLKIPLIFLLMRYEGNVLRFYAVGMCVVEGLMFLAYHVICFVQYHPVVKHKYYKPDTLFKEILSFNGYNTLGAAASVVSNQGAAMIANFFLGTLVNGALALANQVERYVRMLVANLATSSAPQITQNYSGGNYARSQNLVEKLTRYMIYATIILIMVLSCDLEFILAVWLKEIPEGTLELCQWIMLCLFFRSFGSCISTVLSANGRIKESSICSTLIGVGYPVALFILLKIGFPPVTIVILFAIFDMISKAINLYIVYRICHFDVPHYIKTVYPSVLLIGALCAVYYVIRIHIPCDSIPIHLVSIVLSLLLSAGLCLGWTVMKGNC